jgi:tetratricopeptide (TPR) repeat protein
MISLLLVIAHLTFPPPLPPTASSGYYVNAQACVGRKGRPGNAQATPRPPADPSATLDPQFKKERPALHEAYLAQYQDWLRHYSAAIPLYRKAIALSPDPPYVIDAEYRLPLSVDLYRTGKRPDAVSQWRKMLMDNSPYRYEIDSATRDAVSGRFHDALVAHARGNGPPFNGDAFGDSGAAYNVQRGETALAKGSDTSGQRFLSDALECSPEFGVPHLVLGVMYASRGQRNDAIDQWIQALQSNDRSPDVSLAPVQFDAHAAACAVGEAVRSTLCVVRTAD